MLVAITLEVQEDYVQREPPVAEPGITTYFKDSIEQQKYGNYSHDISVHGATKKDLITV